MINGHSIEETRTVVFINLIMSNVFLTFADRSFTKTIVQSIQYKNSLAFFIIIVSMIFLGLLYFSPGIQTLFQLTSISPGTFGLCLITSLTGVGWFEIYKWVKAK
jgi:Ca2+-transporting ATPase